MISGLTILAIGFFLGMRHATDPDHVIAVSTIISREPSLGRAGWIGALWGLGHTLTILLVGAAIILFNVDSGARRLDDGICGGADAHPAGNPESHRRDALVERKVFSLASAGDRRPRPPSRAWDSAALSLAFAPAGGGASWRSPGGTQMAARPACKIGNFSLVAAAADRHCARPCGVSRGGAAGADHDS